MEIEKQDILWGAEQGIVSPEQATDLWDALLEKKGDAPRFNAVYVAYYFGAALIMAAMGWLLGDAWDRLGDTAITIIALAYCLGFFLAGRWLWSSKGLRVPGGLLLTVAVWMIPMVVYGVEKLIGWWPGLDPGEYRGYYSWIKGGWFLMEVATVLAGLVLLRFFRFPFLTFPIAFALWFMSMDLAPLLYGVEDRVLGETRQVVSMVFGLLMLVGAYLVDRRTREDFAFWIYLFGLMAFWGGLTALDSDSEFGRFIYCLTNLGLVALSVLLQRKVFLVFGSVGVSVYLGSLSFRAFNDVLGFSLALTLIGLFIIYCGVQYQKHHKALDAWVMRAMPPGLRKLLPQHRG